MRKNGVRVRVDKFIRREHYEKKEKKIGWEKQVSSKNTTTSKSLNNSPRQKTDRLVRVR